METTPGKRVQILREAKGYSSLTAFAEFTKLKVGTLSALEKDKSAPSFETIARLLESFPDLNLDWLISGAGPMLRDGRTLTPAPPSPQMEPTTSVAASDADTAGYEAAGEAKMPATVKRKFDTPMAVARDVESMTKDEQIAYHKAVAEMLEEELAALKQSQRHEKVVRLVKSAGGQSFTNASSDAANPCEIAVMAISHRNPDLPIPQRFVPQPAEQPRRIVVGGFGN